MEKPVAWYDTAKIYTTRDGAYIVAEAYNVEHPALGREPTVYTSVVVAGDEDGFETLNTVYKKRKQMKNSECNGCFYEEADPRDAPCRSCWDSSKYVQRDVFKDVSDSPIFKERYDTVNKPKHYMLFEQQGIEVRDVLEKLVGKLNSENTPGTALFEADYVQMLQYVMRFMEKNGQDDLRKARWYLDKMIAAYE